MPGMNDWAFNEAGKQLHPYKQYGWNTSDTICRKITRSALGWRVISSRCKSVSSRATKGSVMKTGLEACPICQARE